MSLETSQTGGRDDALVVETRGLTKRYGPLITAVEDLDLSVRRGEVYGFLVHDQATFCGTVRCS